MGHSISVNKAWYCLIPKTRTNWDLLAYKGARLSAASAMLGLGSIGCQCSINSGRTHLKQQNSIFFRNRSMIFLYKREPLRYRRFKYLRTQKVHCTPGSPQSRFNFCRVILRLGPSLLRNWFSTWFAFFYQSYPMLAMALIPLHYLILKPRSPCAICSVVISSNYPNKFVFFYLSHTLHAPFG